MQTSSIEEKQAIEEGSKLAVEAIANIRTVASLGQELDILSRYITEIVRAETACRQKIRFRGVVYALGQTAPQIAYGIAFTYGGILVANYQLEYENLIKVTEALIFGTWMLGNALAYAPNVSVAFLSAGRLLKIIDRVPQYRNVPSLPNEQSMVQFDFYFFF